MTAMTGSIEVREYVAAVKLELADLAADERADLLGDLEDHLHEVLAEGEGSLEQRLGPAKQYAAELRSSAGLDPLGLTSGSTANLLHRAIDAMSANALWRRTAERPFTRATLDFLSQLRPAWWIVRGWLAVALVVQVDRWRTGYGVRGYLQSDELALIPRIGGSQGLAVILLVAAIPLSIWIGRMSLRGVAWWVVTACNLAAAAIAVIAVAALSSQHLLIKTVDVPPQFGLINNGHRVANIYPYDAQGHPLDHVRLFDDQGQLLIDSQGVPTTTVAPPPAVVVSPLARH